MAKNLVKPYTLAIESSDGSFVEGAKVRAFNRTTGELLTAEFDSNGQAVIELAEYPTAWTDADVIEISMVGKYEGFTTHTISETGSGSGTGDIAFTTAAITPGDWVSVSL